MSNINHSYRFR